MNSKATILEPQTLLVDGDTHGHYTIDNLLANYYDQLTYDCGTKPVPPTTIHPNDYSYWEHRHNLDWREFADQISEDICDGNVSLLAKDGTTYLLTWSEGSLWAIHPEAEYCETCDSYHWSSDYLEVTEFTVASHYASALINNDWSGLEEDDTKTLESFLKRNPYHFMSPICPNWESEFARCEVYGLMADCITLTVFNKDLGE